ncbi:BnaC01g36640D [Brassica napus]|uniref:BnaC01g36640D protein n=1 Tax=Brassica napus TaxID=3708 RepID=A0A078H0V4_BRANA|nr:BnaC01g36640D [Brassica napus]
MSLSLSIASKILTASCSHLLFPYISINAFDTTVPESNPVFTARPWIDLPLSTSTNTVNADKTPVMVCLLKATPSSRI